MTRKGIKDAELERRLRGRLSRSQISRIRRRKSIPSVEAARALEEVTKIPAAKLLLVERA
jgi:transcriptional regulator with XRE-family HTH domain